MNRYRHKETGATVEAVRWDGREEVANEFLGSRKWSFIDESLAIEFGRKFYEIAFEGDYLVKDESRGEWGDLAMTAEALERDYEAN